MNRKKKIIHIWQLLRDSVRRLTGNDLLRMAGATAFFTCFALPPILMIIVRSLGLFLGRKTVGRQLGRQIGAVLGPDSIASIRQTIRSFSALQHNALVTVLLTMFLLFVATTLFRVIKNSVNDIWNVRRVPGGGLSAVLLSRGLSLLVILLGGVLFLCVQLVDAGKEVLGRYLNKGFRGALGYIGPGLDELIVGILTAIWFFALFTLLPDARPDRRAAIYGALLTSLLFNTGKWILQLLLQPGQIRSFYGVSGALALVLLFVFYSSIILYFGAAFIKVWSDRQERPMRLRPYAQRYRLEAFE